jgi:hypothetical protein
MIGSAASENRMDLRWHMTVTLVVSVAFMAGGICYMYAIAYRDYQAMECWKQASKALVWVPPRTAPWLYGLTATMWLVIAACIRLVHWWDRGEASDVQSTNRTWFGLCGSVLRRVSPYLLIILPFFTLCVLVSDYGNVFEHLLESLLSGMCCFFIGLSLFVAAPRIARRAYLWLPKSSSGTDLKEN